MAINKVSGNILADNLQRGANLSIQGNLIYFDVSNDRVGIKTVSPTADLEVAGTFRVGNVLIDSLGNINAGNVYINNLTDPVQIQDAATKQYVDSQIGNIQLGNFTFSNTTISTSYSPGNITLQPTGNSTVIIDTNSGLILPTGTTGDRPSPATAGTIRFNTTLTRVEVYDGSAWDDIVANVTNQTLYGDNSTTDFSLDRVSTSASALVMLNGVVQLPDTAYIITGNSISFTQAPAVSDTIDIRFL